MDNGFHVFTAKMPAFVLSLNSYETKLIFKIAFAILSLTYLGSGTADDDCRQLPTHTHVSSLGASYSGWGAQPQLPVNIDDIIQCSDWLI